MAKACFDAAKAKAGQVAAVENRLAHAAVEEWGWRKVQLEGAPATELDLLRIFTGVHRGGAEWLRIGEEREDLVAVQVKPAPWSPEEACDVYAAVLAAVCAEGARVADEIDDLEASWRLPAATPQDQP